MGKWPEKCPTGIKLPSWIYYNNKCRDFPGGPVVKTLPFNARGAGLIPGLGAKIPHALGPKSQKTYNRSNIVANSIKTLKTWSTSKKSLKK